MNKIARISVRRIDLIKITQLFSNFWMAMFDLGLQMKFAGKIYEYNLAARYRESSNGGLNTIP